MPSLPEHLRFLATASGNVGLSATVRWFWYRFLQTRNIALPEGCWTLRAPALLHPVTVRLGRTSDLRIVEQILMLDEYGCLRGLRNVSLVLDLGANIGLSAAYFLTCFPSAMVLSVEPDPHNGAVCALNLAPYGKRARLVRGAVWPQKTRVRISAGTEGAGQEWGRRVEASHDTESGIEAWDVGPLIDETGIAVVDLLKIDVEGAEALLFAEDADRSWLSRTRNLYIELHGEQCRKIFFKAMEPFEYDMSSSQELTICRNIRPR